MRLKTTLFSLMPEPGQDWRLLPKEEQEAWRLQMPAGQFILVPVSSLILAQISQFIIGYIFNFNVIKLGCLWGKIVEP